ncbi:MAG: DNA primase [Patescibacteria group bacterium]|jgi:DNA primase
MDEIEEIRSKIDLVQYISETVPLKKAGRNFKACCPFHAEKTPSFMVNPERQIWKCFGCQKGGDIFGFVMETERLEFGEALRLLAKKAGVTLKSYQPSKTESEKEKFYQINHLASEYFHYLLLNHQIGQKALTYILERGISKDSLKQFKIGYSPPFWDGIQKFLVNKKGYLVQDLEKAGLVIKSDRGSFYDRFRDRLMFSLLDHRGNVTGFAGRLLDPNAKEAKYVNTPETAIYHKSDLLYPLQITKEDIKKENCAVVVEGELDAISTYQSGIKNVVAIKGSALTEQQARLLKRFCENLILSLDSDSAGDMAARRGIEIADSLGFNLKVVTLEKYKDPDEAAQKEPEYLKQRLSEAVGVYDFYLDSAFKRFRGKTPEEKKKIGQELTPLFAKIEDEIIKDIYVKKLAERLAVNEESIILQVEKQKGKTQTTSKQGTDQLPKNRLEVLEEYFLALVFQSKKTEFLLSEEGKGLVTLPVNVKLREALEQYSKDNKKFSSQFFFKSLPVELREAFDRMYLVDFGNRIEDSAWVDKELENIKIQIQIVKAKEELQAFLQKMREKTEGKGGEVEKQIQERILTLTQKLANLGKAL